ncbi:MAG TPA: Cof-type HAD-IIB family hydrolase, partial [Lachnospiraceae bacterium]|nr:Cof-type HAD-IIB family hydrolase [Lachnospiraceae bacterium]
YRTHPCYVEVVPGGVSKGHALQWLCRRLGIRPENSLAAGDSENDLSMLQAAATGILMRNGAEMNPYLKDGADLVTEYDNDRDGLARTLASILDRIDA